MESAAQLAFIQEALREVVRALGAAAPSPRTRELRARVTTYERVVGGWTFRPPTGAQCAAMLECVMEVHALVLGATRSQRPPPWAGAPPSHASSRGSTPPVRPSIRAASTRTTRPPPPSLPPRAR